MVQSSNTKAENLESDFNEIAAAIREMGWGDVSDEWTEFMKGTAKHW